MKHLKLTFLLVMLMSMTGTKAFAYDFKENGIYYNYNDDGTVSVTYNAFLEGTDYSGSITIPERVTHNGVSYDVTSIDENAFLFCNVTSISIPQCVTSIGAGAFEGTPWYDSQPYGMVYAGLVAYHYKGYMPLGTEIVLKDGTKGIADEAFVDTHYYESRSKNSSAREGLVSIIIPNSVVTIGNEAFDRCLNLTSINIPKSVLRIGESICPTTLCLTSISVDKDNPIYDSRNNCNAIIETATNKLIQGCKTTIIPYGIEEINSAFVGQRGLTSITIPSSVKVLERAFVECYGLTSITIPSNVTDIGRSAFFRCKGLTSIIIPNSVKNLGEQAFYDCDGITSVTIPNSVTSIHSMVFAQCVNLTSCTIGSSVTSIGAHMFLNCKKLTDVYCYAENVPNTNRYAFDTSTNPSITSATLHVLAGALEAYRTTAPWSNFGTIVAIEDDEVTATDVTAMSYAVYAQPAKARKGSQTTLNVCMKNTQPITLWQADLTLPAGFSLATDSYGDPMVSISGSRTSTSRHSISTSTLPDGSIRILCSSSSNKTFAGTDGEVATITLNVASNVTEGDYAVKFNNIKLVEADETKHEVDEVISAITVKNYTLGDVNDDGSIDGADLVGIVNYILDRPTSGNIFEAADVNLDGVIDGGDYVREVNAILGKVVLSARRKASKAEAAEADYAIYTSDLEDDADNQATLCLNMKNQQPVTLWQADLVLPEGVSIATDNFDDPMVYITGGRTTEARHAIATNTLPDGSIRILCSSSSNKTFTGNDGEVATITLNIDKDMLTGEYPVALKNILIVEADETRHTCEPVEYTLNVTHTTGISRLLTSPEEERVYNLAGQRLSNMQKGINIVNGKKVLVK